MKALVSGNIADTVIIISVDAKSVRKSKFFPEFFPQNFVSVCVCMFFSNSLSLSGKIH